MNRSITLMVVFACTAMLSVANAQQLPTDWAQKLFEVEKHDFGPVGKGANAEFHFVIKNTLDQEVVVSRLRTSCGCTSPSINKGTIPPGETSAVIAKFNTDTFTGAKSATVTVEFLKPVKAEAQLQVSGFIRTDVSVSPRIVDFGSFRDGEAKPVELVVSYTGRSNWQIQDVRSQFGQLQVSMTARRNLVNTGGYSYTLKIGLKDETPVGAFRERMTLITNETTLKAISIDVVGRVEPDLILTPATLSLGAIAKGTISNKRLVLRGPVPFEIKSVKSKDRRLQFEVAEGKKALHFVTVKFSAGQTTGKFLETIEIETDLKGSEKANCPVSGEVL